MHVFGDQDEGKGVRVCYIFHAFEGTNYADLVVFELLSRSTSFQILPFLHLFIIFEHSFIIGPKTYF